MTITVRTTLTLTSALLATAALAAPQPVTVEVKGGELSGTLELPGGQGPFPVALIIAGSGPTDRDGNSAAVPGTNDSLKLLAEQLAAQGVASVRYDKRGVGASAALLKSEAEITLDDFVNDAAAWIARLKADPRFDGVSVIGHSEGALIGTLAAQREGAKSVVSVAGPGQDIGATILRQLRANPANPAALVTESERILTELRAGRTVSVVSAPLQPLFRPGVQPYMISSLKHDPARELARLKVPVLVVQGDADLQVRPEDARLLKAARPDARLVILPGVNHVLKTVGSDMQLNVRSYGDPGVPFAEGLGKTVADFIKGTSAR